MRAFVGNLGQLRLGALLCALAASVAGCAGPEALEPLVSFEDDWMRDATERVEIHIVPSCRDVFLGAPPQTTLASTYVPKNGEPGPAGGEFEAGDSFGLYAMGRDDECEVIAASCRDIASDSDEPLAITLRDVDAFGPPCPFGQQCGGDGECVDSPCAGIEDREPCEIAGKDGQCRSGSCCTGCWDGWECRSGTRSSACGSNGERCEDVNNCPF